MSDNTSGKETPQLTDTAKEEMSEPKDMSLEEQVDCEPPPEMESQTEDFETKASVAGCS